LGISHLVQINTKGKMNTTIMNDKLNVVNSRVSRMLDASDINNESFFRDVRTLTELVEHKLQLENEVIG
jgi:hypothetical protein